MPSPAMTPFEKAAAIERDRQWGEMAPGDPPWSEQRKADALFMAGYDRRGLLNELGWRALVPAPSEPKEAEHEQTGTVARGTHPRGLPERGMSDVSSGATTRPPRPPAPPKDREWDGS